MRFTETLTAAVAALVLVASCAEDKTLDVEELPGFNENSYLGTTLQMTCSDAALLGKTVVLKPVAGDKTKGVLVITGTDYTFKQRLFQTSSICGKAEAKVDVDVAYTEEGLTFTGAASLEDYELECSGSVAGENMALDVHTTIQENPLLGKYQLKSEGALNFSWKDQQDQDFSITLPPLINKPYALTDAVLLLMSMLPVVPDPSVDPAPGEAAPKITPIEALPKYVKNLEFTVNGDVRIAPEKTPDVYTPLNVATYAAVTETGFKLFMNPFGAEEYLNEKNPSPAPAPASKAVDQQAVLDAVMNQLSAELAEGMDLSYSVVDQVLAVNLDEETLLPLLQTVKPLLEDPESVQLLTDKIIANLPANMKPMSALLKPALPKVFGDIAGFIGNTKTIELGLNFIPQPAA